MKKTIGVVVVCLMFFLVSRCGDTELIIGANEFYKAEFMITKTGAGEPFRGIIRGLGYLQSGEKIVLIFSMPVPVIREGYENNGEWRNDSFQSFVGVFKGDATEAYVPLDKIRFKIIERNSQRMVFVFSGCYFNSVTKRYIKVEEGFGVWEGDTFKDAIDYTIPQTP